VVTAAAIPPTVALAGAINSAIWPLTLIVVAIAAVIAVVIALVSWFNQIKADNVKKANKELDKSFDSTKGKIIGITDAQNQWTAALLSVNDSSKAGIKDIKDVGKALNGTEVAYGKGGRTITQYNHAVDEAREVMDVYLTNLSKLAKKNLPESQRQFRNMVVSQGLNRKATELAITSNEEMVASLEKQAKAMGDTIMNADGTVNAMKAVDYAIGEGAYTARRAVIDQQKFAETFKNAAKSFIDTNDAMQKATTDGKFSLKTYLKELRNQGTALTNWRNNISKLNLLFTNKDALQRLVAQGAAGADLVQSLASGGKAAVAEFTAAGKAANDAKREADLFAAAYGSTLAVESIAKKKSRPIAQAVAADIARGLGAFEIAAKYKFSEEAIIAEQKRLQAGADLAQKVNITAAWDEDSLDTIRDQLVDGIGGVKIVASATSKDGQHFDKIKNGGVVARFADGWGPSYNGRVSGLGTARSDQIPAMISNGEFVVNARATSQNLALLNAINGNRNVSGMGSGMSIVVNAAPGMDEQQVASLVAYQLRAEMRKGATI
jgi:hypothetical protein